MLGYLVSTSPIPHPDTPSQIVPYPNTPPISPINTFSPSAITFSLNNSGYFVIIYLIKKEKKSIFLVFSPLLLPHPAPTPPPTPFACTNYPPPQSLTVISLYSETFFYQGCLKETEFTLRIACFCKKCHFLGYFWPIFTPLKIIPPPPLSCYSQSILPYLFLNNF